MIIFQSVVSGDNKYKFSNQANLTTFDVHNDSPYNVGVSFGVDTGIQNADYYTSAHSFLLGIGPLAVAQRSVGGVKFNGTVYIYTQTPLGGGTTNLASVPASQITAIGYPTGSNPNNTASMSRWNNIGNPVESIMGGSTSVQNDNNVSGTSVIESTVTGAPGSNLSFLNSGSSFIAEWIGSTYTKLLQVLPGATNALLLGAASRVVEVLGTLQVDGTGDSFLAGTTWFGGTSGAAANAVIHQSGASEFGAQALFDAGLRVLGSVGASNGVLVQSNSNGDLILTQELNSVSPFRADSTNVFIMQNTTGGHLYFYNKANVRIASMDNAGNLILKGALTQNGTP